MGSTFQKFQRLPCWDFFKSKRVSSRNCYLEQVKNRCRLYSEVGMYKSPKLEIWMSWTWTIRWSNKVGWDFAARTQVLHCYSITCSQYQIGIWSCHSAKLVDSIQFIPNIRPILSLILFCSKSMNVPRSIMKYFASLAVTLVCPWSINTFESHNRTVRW